VLWVGYIYDTAIKVAFVVVLADAGARTVASRMIRRRVWDLEGLFLVLAVLFSLPLFVRALPFYWVLSMPFYAALSAIELRRWFAIPDG
jgi:hypothetical protein